MSPILNRRFDKLYSPISYSNFRHDCFVEVNQGIFYDFLETQLRRNKLYL